jgi:anaerobic ribonucleoside-triphosphate reductase
MLTPELMQRVCITVGTTEETDCITECMYYVSIRRGAQCHRCGQYDVFWIGNIRVLNVDDMSRERTDHPYTYTEQWMRVRRTADAGPSGRGISFEHALSELLTMWLRAGSPMELI